MHRPLPSPAWPHAEPCLSVPARRVRREFPQRRAAAGPRPRTLRPRKDPPPATRGEGGAGRYYAARTGGARQRPRQFRPLHRPAEGQHACRAGNGRRVRRARAVHRPAITTITPRPPPCSTPTTARTDKASFPCLAQAKLHYALHRLPAADSRARRLPGERRPDRNCRPRRRHRALLRPLQGGGGYLSGAGQSHRDAAAVHPPRPAAEQDGIPGRGGRPAGSGREALSRRLGHDEGLVEAAARTARLGSRPPRRSAGLVPLGGGRACGLVARRRADCGGEAAHRRQRRRAGGL